MLHAVPSAPGNQGIKVMPKEMGEVVIGLFIVFATAKHRDFSSKEHNSLRPPTIIW